MFSVYMNEKLQISTTRLLDLFPDAESARVYFERQRWNGQIECPHCSASEKITARKGKRIGYYCCGTCKAEFSVRTNTIFERSHVPLQKWIYAIALTDLVHSEISSTLLADQIGVTQKTAWKMLSKVREVLNRDSNKDEMDLFSQ